MVVLSENSAFFYAVKTNENNPVRQPVEIMAPAGSFESLSAALRAGAGSVYFGVGKLNMRAHAAGNFSAADLPRVARLCHACGARAYLTCNVVIYDDELGETQELLRAAKEAGVDAVIAADMAVIRFAHSIGLEVHISVQANVSNTEALRSYAQYAYVVVPARELTLGRVRTMVHAVQSEPICGPNGKPLRIELFAHGALCIAISGKCGMSLAAHNHSANRGDCYQLCRRRYRAVDAETGFELEVDNQYIMSPADLCTIRVLDQLLDAGVSVLKLEGRGRSAAYVSTVTAVYREAAQAWARGDWNEQHVQAWEERLRSVFNRSFWHGGYYLGELWDGWSGAPGSHAAEQRDFTGTVLKFYPRVGVAEIRLNASDLQTDAIVEITGPTTGILRHTITDMRADDPTGATLPVSHASKGSVVLVQLPQKVRRGDKVYTVRTRKLS